MTKKRILPNLETSFVIIDIVCVYIYIYLLMDCRYQDGNL